MVQIVNSQRKFQKILSHIVVITVPADDLEPSGTKTHVGRLMAESGFRIDVFSLLNSVLTSVSLNSFSPGDACIRQKTRPSLVQSMACRLFGATSISAAMLAYCYLDH